MVGPTVESPVGHAAFLAAAGAHATRPYALPAEDYEASSPSLVGVPAEEVVPKSWFLS